MLRNITLMRLHTPLNQRRQAHMLPTRHLAPNLLPKLIIPLTNRLVNIHLPYPPGADTLPDQLIRKIAKPMQNQMLLRGTRLANGLQPGQIQILRRAASGVRTVHVPERRRQEIHARLLQVGDRVARLRQQAVHVRRVDAVLRAVDAAHLRFDRDAHAVRARRQLLRELGVLLGRVVAHVDHDAVEAEVHGELAVIVVLAVVDVGGDVGLGAGCEDGDACDEVVRCGVEGPGEDLDDGGRGLGFGGADGRED